MTQPTDTPPQPDEPVDPPTDPAEPPQEPRTDDDNPETFSREYVEELRAESAKHRTEAKKAEEYLTALRTAAIEHTAGRVLQDASVLEWSDELADEHGMPDPEKIMEAADALAKEKPHLSKVGGPTPQGFRGEESDADDVSLVGLLRG